MESLSVPLQKFLMCTLYSVHLEIHASGRKVFSEAESYHLLRSRGKVENFEIKYCFVAVSALNPSMNSPW